MKIISFESARVTRLFPLEEFAPAAGSNGPSIIDQIAQRYGFTILPKITTRDDFNKNGLVFGMGGFRHNDRQFTITDFVVYTDGIVAAAQKTEWAEEFLEDITTWVINNFDFRHIASGVTTLYTSTVVVDFETSPSMLVMKLKQISDFISDRIVTIAPQGKEMNFGRLDFAISKFSHQPTNIKFVLERRSGVSFAQERYFSSAPMTTSNHIEALEEIERVAASV